MKATKDEIKSIPLFIKDNEDEILILPSDSDQMPVEAGYKLMYLGKKLS